MNRTFCLPHPVRSRIQSASVSDAHAAIATLTRAFQDDPGLRWLYPQPDAFERHFPRFARAFGGAAFESGTAQQIDGGRAVALWLPPGVHPDDEALGALLESTLDPGLRSAAFVVFEQLAALHPEEPHWHLPLIGTDPEWRNRGLGSELLRHGLSACDREGLPAYLEATSPRNARLYARHGFQVVGVVQSGGSPPILPMVRPPTRRRSTRLVPVLP